MSDKWLTAGWTVDELNVLVKNLGEENARKIQRGEMKIDFDKLVNIFPIWKTIQLGTQKTVNGLQKSITRSGANISDWSKDIMFKPEFTLSKEKKDVDLVILSVKELGFPDGATRQQIFDKAQSIGLELCPAEVGPQLRLQYTDQPKGEWLLIAMNPIKDSDGDPNVFFVLRHDDGSRWLHAYYDFPGHVWYPASRWVFSARK